MTSTVGIVGSGAMGSGIAQVAAMAGFDVILYDVVPEAVTSAMERIRTDLHKGREKGITTTREATEALARIHRGTSFKSLARAQVIIEAASEDLDIKKEIFTKLEKIASPHTVLATNTSSLSITLIGAFTKEPGSVVGMHFFNPPVLMKLVEIVRGSQTTDTSVEVVRDLALRMKKTPVVCKDTPGFIVNRVARPFYGEALRLLGEGVATVEQIDAIVKGAGGFRMGPFELMDLIGIDVNYAVTKSVYERFFHEPRFRPHAIQRRMVEAGTLGRKTGKGFYTYK